MNDDIGTILEKVYGWTEGRVPHQDLPEFVKERIALVVKIGGALPVGLSAQIEAVMDFDDASSVLPAPSDDFLEWRDRAPMLREFQIATELMYGKDYEVSEDED